MGMQDMHLNSKLAGLVLLGLTFSVVGCSGETPAPVVESTPPVAGRSPEERAKKGTAESAPIRTEAVVAPVQLAADELAEIAKLPADEQELAKKQTFCLINQKGHLGAMGVPIKVTHEAKVGFLCCEGCKEAFDKDPAAAFASFGR